MGSFGCQLINNPAAPNPCVNHSNFTNLNAVDLDRTFSGFRSRANLSWKVTEDALLYYTWSQGFRAGGFNQGRRSAGDFAAAQRDRRPVKRKPASTGAGCRRWPLRPTASPTTSWAGRRCGWAGASNGMARSIRRTGTMRRVERSTRACIGNAVIPSTVATTGCAASRPLAWRASRPGSPSRRGANWNHSELVKQATFLWADGTPIDFSIAISPDGQFFRIRTGTLGSPLAGAPPFQGNIRARYDFAFNGYDAFAQIGAVHQSHSLATTDQLALDLQGNSMAYDLPAFTTYDGALGIGRDAWLVQVYGENLTDTRAQLFANYCPVVQSDNGESSPNHRFALQL